MKKSIAAALTALLLILQGLPFALAESVDYLPEPSSESNYTVQSFVISAYYSPLPGQTRYATGSYEGDIRLNGNGTNGADGTEVYPGMVAAPSKYAFGTKLYIPGIGQTTIHDRGGAIVSSDGPDSRGYAYDRLDIWMGHGDEGLTRALQWGKRTVHGVLNYGVNPNIADQVYLQGYTAAESFIQSTFISPLHFKKDIFFGTEGEEVKEMQDYLVQWAYLEEATGFYGDSTAEALFQFQLDFNIVSSQEELGAGHFGINTRTQFDRLIQDEKATASLLKQKQGEALLVKYTDLHEEKTDFNESLGLGARGAKVTQLQEELYKLSYLRVPATGYFDEVTEHAVFKFQQAQGILNDPNDAGAGYVGPATRSALNKVMSERYNMKLELAYQREAVSEGRHLVLVPEGTLAFRNED